MLNGLKRISMTLALGAATLTASDALAQAPGTPNQAMADSIALALRSSGGAQGARISIDTQGGMVTLSGVASSAAQKNDLLRVARSASQGWTVSDRIAVSSDTSVRAAQYEGAQYAGPSGPMMGGDMGGPMPEGMAGMPGVPQASSPSYPNYAWPSYAPHPNYSAVGYPTAYPWQAWPNIGPFYPYPEVPLDWRAVTLRWDDGIWWLDFKKHYTRPFFTPYPFGLFAY